MDIVYEAIKKIPGITNDEAHEVATKLRSREEVATKKDFAELKDELTWRMVIMAGVILAGVGVLLTIFGLIVKF